MLDTGTVTGQNALLEALVDWLVNTVGWTEVAYDGVLSPSDTTSIREAVLRSSGGGSGTEYYVHLRTENNVGAGHYGIRMRAMASYDGDLGVDEQLLVSPAVYLNVWNASIDYWFYASGRRFIVVAKSGTAYNSAYAGLFLPFALPSEYPRPFYVGASYPELEAYNVANARNRMIADPGQGAAYYLKRDQSAWGEVANHENSANDTDYFASDAGIWPHRSFRFAGPNDNSNSATHYPYWNMNGLLRMRPADGGELPSIQCHLYTIEDDHFVGALDGVYAASGFNRSAEQEVSYGSPATVLRLFPNVSRSTGRDFMAIEEDAS